MKTMQVLSMMLLLSACASKVEQESSVSFPIATPETPVQRAEVPDVKTMTQTPTPSAKVTVAPCKETPQPQATTAEIEAKIKEDLADFEWSDVLYENSPIGSLFANHQKESEYITITPHPTENQSVKGKEGTVFTFAPECFVDEIGNTVTTPIQLEIKECYGLADILSTNLTTTCNEQPIETAGMFYIQATTKGKPVRLRQDKPMLVEMPSKGKPNKNMQLFYGDKQLVSGVMNWIPAMAESNMEVERFATTSFVPRSSYGFICGNDDLYAEIFDIGKITLAFEVQAVNTRNNPNNIPEIKVKVEKIHPSLEKYKAEIETALNRLSWSDGENNRANFLRQTNFYSAEKECHLAKPIHINADKLTSIREELLIYKNATIKKELDLIGKIKMVYYYERTGLIGYSKNTLAFSNDLRYFRENFTTVKQKGNNHYEEMMANFNENKYKIITTYSPQYADNYIFAVNRFGWGNCDMFSRDAGPKEMLTVKSEHTKNTDVKLLILKRNSILPSSPFNNMYRFSGIPRGTQAIIIATHVKNKKASFAFQPVTIGKEAVVTLTNFEEMSFANLEKKLLTL